MLFVLFILKEVEIILSFIQPKVRLGNKTMTQSQLQERRRHAHRTYNAQVRNKVDKDLTKFYQSSQWRKMRAQALVRDNYLCQRCLAKGIVNDKRLIVHHKRELREDWGGRLNLDNLETVCTSCHNRLHKLK